MKKVIITLTSILSVLAVGVGALFYWEYRSKAQLEAQVEDYLGTCDVKPSHLEVHGRPFILSAMAERAELTYVDVAPQPGMNKDQLLVRELADGKADRVTRFVTFDYPKAGAQPVEDADGAYTDKATIDGKTVKFSGTAGDGRLEVFADGRSFGELPLRKNVTLTSVFANQSGVAAELEYAGPTCALA
ncbi:hypothetical protein [Brevibacterium sp. XM4083]|uniref:hypothetical protein n=1 Tax=Brevibacterium sp. XM4083 TaxID=2583238 RepID=UPI00112AD774|nr:hypothetical protein [Brevibacterium sp. XM4083]MCM1014103.1 hypothetical protein [Brevibacterium sp. XM4083]